MRHSYGGDTEHNKKYLSVVSIFLLYIDKFIHKI